MDGEERGDIMGVPSRERFGDSWCGDSAVCLLIRNCSRSRGGAPEEGLA